MNSAEIIAAARSCLDTPFRHQGRIPGRSLDCAGVIVHVAATLGLKYNDVAGYSRLPSGGMLEAALDSQPCLYRVDIADMQAGDILLMRFEGDPQHLALFTGENIIHAYLQVGRVVEHRLDEVWERRIVRVYRFKGFA